jgi:hypothetical protein
MFQGILEPISNRADWFGTVELVNDDTGEVITDLDGAVIKICVRERGCYGPLLSAQTGDDRVSIIGEGVIQWHFTPSDLRCLCPGTYDLGITITRDGITDQEVVATLPVIDGVACR